MLEKTQVFVALLIHWPQVDIGLHGDWNQFVFKFQMSNMTLFLFLFFIQFFFSDKTCLLLCNVACVLASFSQANIKKFTFFHSLHRRLCKQVNKPRHVNILYSNRQKRKKKNKTQKIRLHKNMLVYNIYSIYIWLCVRKYLS